MPRTARLVLTVGAAAIAAGVVACARSHDVAPPPGPGPVAATTRIADVDVATAAHGAWTHRVARREASGGERFDTKPHALRRMAGEASAPGAKAAPAAPAPPETLLFGDARVAGGLVPLGDPSRDVPRMGPMRAGSTDDNADYAAFLGFLTEWTGQDRLAAQYQPIDVRDRRFVRVLDAAGRPVPAARVTVLDEAADRLVADVATLGDGRAAVFPRAGSRGGALPASVVAEVRHAAGTVRGRFGVVAGETAPQDWVLRLSGDAPPPDPVPLDVTFLIDTTGSMGDEIASIQACLLRVTAKIRGLARESDLRYATVLYRDVGDEYLTATHPFTADVDALDRALREVSANGGGDGPESLNQGLSEAVNGLAWRDGAAKVVFLIADARPHMDYKGDVPYGDTLQRAAARGIRIHTVAASGLDAAGTVVFRQIAQYTRGTFVFIEYGVPGTTDDAVRHGVGGAVKNDNLEDVIFDRVRDEVARWGR